MTQVYSCLFFSCRKSSDSEQKHPLAYLKAGFWFGYISGLNAVQFPLDMAVGPAMCPSAALVDGLCT